MRCGAILVVLAAGLAAQTPAPEQKGTIHGVVKDTSGAPVAEIKVSAAPPNSGPRPMTAPDGTTYILAGAAAESSVTDENGAYTLKGLAADSYSVSVNGSDRTLITSSHVQLDTDQDLTLDFTIPANPVIGGRVLNQNDEIVVDAFVWLLKPEYQDGRLKQIVVGPKVTGEDGTYLFDTGLETNRRYYVLVDRPPADEIVPATPGDLKERAPIEIPTYFPSASRMDAATPVILQSGERREQTDIKIVMAQFACIEGKIPVSGAPSSFSFAIYETTLADTRLARTRSSAAEDGTYHVCGLSQGSYRLSTSAGSTEFVVSNSDRRNVDPSLEDMANVRVRVDWDDPPKTPDEPKLDGADEATLRKLAGLMGITLAGDDDEKALLARVAPPGPTDLEVGNVLIRVGKSDDRALITELGALIAKFRRPGDMVSINLSGPSNPSRPGLTVRIPSDGFRNGVPAGDYALDFQSFGPNDSYVKEVTYNDLKVDGPVRITPGSRGTIHIVMSRGTAALTVDLTDGDGKPAPDATVLIIPDSVTSVPMLSRILTRGQADQNGRFASPSLYPGKYRVLASRQTIRWGVPEDLEKVLLSFFQAKEVELAPHDKLQITLAPLPL